MKKPITPTAAETPRVTHGDLDNLIGQLHKAQEIISLTPFPDVRTKPAESVLPHQATSTSYLSSPDAYVMPRPLCPKYGYQLTVIFCEILLCQKDRGCSLSTGLILRFQSRRQQ